MTDNSLRKIFLVISFLLPTLPPLFAQSDSAKLASIIDQHWQFRLRANPLFATSVGEHQYNDRLPDLTEEAREEQYRFKQDLLGRLREVEQSQLSEADRINYDFLRFILAEDTTRVAFRAYQVPINAEGGFHTGFVFALQRMPLATVSDYENYLARLQQ